jgi:hypothetical protein
LAGEKIDVLHTNTPFGYGQYSMEVSIGTPPQKFNMIPDVTSPYTFVYNHHCWSLPCFFRPLYDHNKSTSYEESNIKNVSSLTLPFQFTVPGSSVTETLS